jgi:hypothetical protein
VAAVDEMSKANLRRLETTLSWLQSEVEACRLPPATPLPAISGLPVVAPIIDRSTLDRTLHRAPPLPAWLREPQDVPPPVPPRDGGVVWPRAIKFLAACAIAAPLSYYFAMTSSPLQKHLVDVAGWVSADSPVVDTPVARRGLRMSTAAPEAAPAAEVAALAPVRFVEAPAPAPKSAPADIAIRPSAETPVADAPAIPAPAVPAQAAEVETLQAEMPHVEAPRVEAARAEITTGPPATVAAADPAPAAPPPAVRAPATTTVGPLAVKLLIEQGKQFFDVGDLIAARILFLRAANAGDAAAAVAMGATCDPVVLADRGVLGPAADLDKARRWYERAKEMGSPEGPRRLEMLANR